MTARPTARGRKSSRLSAHDPRVRGIRFRRNFGKAAALSAGFDAARGELVVTLDADLQDDPREIPRFLAEMESDLDVVSGWKQVRHDPWHKVLPSRVFNWLVELAHRRQAARPQLRLEVLSPRNLRRSPALRRVAPLRSRAGRRPRLEGRRDRRQPSPAQVRPLEIRRPRIVKGFLDLLTVYFLTGFGQRPQHLLGTIGLIFFTIGFLGLGYLAMLWLLNTISPFENWTPLHQRPAVIYSVGALLLGGQLMGIGFLAELITAFHGAT